MIFLDASAIVAILTLEPEAPDLVVRLDAQQERRTSAVAVYEAALAVARKRGITPAQALDVVSRFLVISDVVQMPITAVEGAGAVQAFARFGKGRHPAKLNMGDCFAYACASTVGAKLLYTGEDFTRTDALSA